MSRLSVVLAVALAALVVVASWMLLEQKTGGFDLEQVAIRGDLDARQQESIASALRAREMRSIGEVRQAITDLEWIFDARVTRRWPNDVLIEIVKETPIAWWNDDAFINADGRVFTSPFVDLSSLPQLYGPEGTEAEVMQQYQMLAKALSRVGQSIDTLRLDERSAWQFETSEGIRVMLGKENIMDRVQRLLLVVERVGLTERMDDIAQIDARYPNGLAVSWTEVSSGLAVAEFEKTDNTKRETRL